MRRRKESRHSKLKAFGEYSENKTSNFLRNAVTTLVVHQEPLLAAVIRLKLAWFGHVARPDTLPTTFFGGVRGSKQKENLVG